jgi:hypothetical protein
MEYTDERFGKRSHGMLAKCIIIWYKLEQGIFIENNI